MRRSMGVVLALGMVTADVGAQEARDSAVFRPGQWGNEFAVSADFSSVSILKFRSPSSAWLLDVGGSLSRSSAEDQGIDRDDTGGSFRLQLGHRWYRAMHPRVYQHFSLGVLGSIARLNAEYSTGAETTSSGNGVGVFGALGANWMVVPHLSLGAAWQVNAERTMTRTTRSPQLPPGTPCPGTCSTRESNTTTRFGFGDVSLRLALYY